MSRLILFMIVFSVVGMAEEIARANAECSTGRPLRDAEVTSEEIARYSNRHGLSLEQLICCLPENWRRNYVIADNSVSAQHSTSHAPRIILYPGRSPGRGGPMGRALSFQIDRTGENSGEHRQSIEMVDLDAQGKPEFSEVRFSQTELEAQARVGHAATPTRNSERCNSCHQGSDGGKFPIFSFAPTWPNTFPRLYKPSVCPTAAEQQAALASRKTLSDTFSQPNTAYACLPGLAQSLKSAVVYGPKDVAPWHQRIGGTAANRPPAVGEQPAKEEKDAQTKKSEIVDQALSGDESFSRADRLGLLVEIFEMDMVRVYNTRLAERIKASRGFANYKFAIAGALLGCFDPREPNLSQWFPRQEIEQQARVLRNRPPQLHPILSGSPSVESLQQALTCTAEQAANHYQSKCFPENCQTTPFAARAIDVTLRAGRARLGNQGPAGAVENTLANMIAQANLDLGRNWLYFARTQHRNPDADTWGTFKFLAAASGSGMDTTTEWSNVIFTSGQSHRGMDDLAKQLVAADSDLRQMAGQGQTPSCEALKDASLRATERAGGAREGAVQ